MTHLRFIFGDQLDHHLPTLQDIDKKSDTVLMCEVIAKAESPHVCHNALIGMA
jgi:deoxyribodipyrimidine photolyase-like uncharacterized protein